MCGGPEPGKSSSSSPASSSPSSSPASSSSSASEGNRCPSPSRCSAGAPTEGATMSHLTVETEDSSSSSLLELAANNDLEGFRLSVERDPSAIDEIGLWYGRKKGSNQMVLEHRTPLMVAATYGSVEILKLILSLDAADVNRCCGSDNTTALHCAASGGSVNALDSVRVLLFAGADRDSVDAAGLRPGDVIVVSPKLPYVKAALEELLLGCDGATHLVGIGDQPHNLRVSLSVVPKPRSPPLSSSPDEDGSPYSMISSPRTGKLQEMLPSLASEKEKKEYPIDPSLPDIKNSIYATDEFRMFSFKVRPCSRAYSHDWTECPFVHPGENARRRDPRKYHYSCVPCPDFRKGACRRGDLCEYAHGVFECWLHPAQYRTRLCKDGTGCTRRVCFFAHTPEELRPLYVSTGSAVPSPRSSASAASAMEMAAAAMSLLPGSPSSVSVMSPTPFTPPMSPSAAGNGISHSSLAWPQPNVPTLHLPGSNLQSSRLRSSLSARDIPVDEFSMLPEFDPQQLLNDFPSFSSNQSWLAASVGSRAGRSKALTPSNLEDLFAMEMSLSPRYNSDQGAVFSQSHKSAVLNQFQQHQQSLLSPINTGIFSSKAADPQLAHSHGSLMQASLGIMSPGRMSPRSVEPISPINSRMAALTQREQQQHLRSVSSRELGAVVGSSLSSWSKWASPPAGKPDWGVNSDELAGAGCFKRSSSFELCSGGEEPDVSWVQSLVKEPSPEIKDKMVATAAAGGESSANGVGSNPNPLIESIDQTVLSAWMEKPPLDQLAT